MTRSSTSNHVSRRALLGQAVAIGAGAAYAGGLLAGEEQPVQGTQQEPAGSIPKEGVKYCLNMSTIREQKLSVPQQVDLAAAAGYDAIEPWMGELHKYVEGGGSLADLKKQIADRGLAVASAIGFAEWIVDDDQRRTAGLETAKRDMGLLAAIGGTHIAAPPAGATKQIDLNLLSAAERFQALIEVGVREGVIPQLEVWGFSTTLSKLGETMFVATESKHPRSCVLLDVYHLYKGGSDFGGLHLVNGAAMHCFHVNDYPAAPPRESIRDADRVYPGDGVAPLTQILRDMFAAGFRGTLSLELFNPTYWKQDPHAVARTGLEKMKGAVARAQEA
ncbi:MAG: sugar phosphate isomerase/epimerase family protein [Pirellulaceae bacterium]